MGNETKRISFDLARLVRFVSIIPDAAVICEETGQIICANDNARTLLKEPELGADSWTLGEFVPSLSRVASVSSFIAAVRGGELDRDLTVRSKDGVEADVWFTTSRIKITEDGFYFVLVTMRDVTERKEYAETLRQFSLTDELTGLYNRRYLREYGGTEIQRATRYGYGVICLFIDLDDFKEINDRYGHRTGDGALVAAAQSLSGTLRKVDLLCRYGGDEFVMIGLVENEDGAHSCVQRVGDSAVNFETTSGESMPMTMSCGAVFTQSPNNWTLDALVDRADREMIAAKAAGKNRRFMVNLDSVDP